MDNLEVIIDVNSKEELDHNPLPIKSPSTGIKVTKVSIEPIKPIQPSPKVAFARFPDDANAPPRIALTRSKSKVLPGQPSKPINF